MFSSEKAYYRPQSSGSVYDIFANIINLGKETGTRDVLVSAPIAYRTIDIAAVIPCGVSH